jgi:quinol monooxygenase YgiN
MKTDSSKMVTIHPYFKAKRGRMPQIKALLPSFTAKTAAEKGNLFYGFTLHGEELFCREAYRDAQALLVHLESVGALLEELLKLADLTRLEVHGPAGELEKLKAPLAKLNPAWWETAESRQR